MSVKKELFLMPHLGLGDAIILCGMIRTLAQGVDRLVFPSKRANLPSIRWMVGDVPNVEVLEVAGDDDAVARSKVFDGEKIYLGIFNDGFREGERYDEAFYRHAGVDYANKQSAFKIPERNLPITSPLVDIFLADDPARGYRIDRSKVRCGKILTPHFTETIFDWKPWILKAREIHCIDSAFLCWIDLMPETGQPLHWHKYARRNPNPSHHPKLIRPWKILD